MKKFLSLLLVALMVVGLCACAADAPATDKGNDDNSAPVSTESALDVMNKIWGAYADDQKFAVGGGDADNIVMDGPGAYDLAQAEGLDATAGIPQAEVEKLQDAATMVHMMNANTFTGAAYHVKEGTDMAALCKAIEENINNRQWMCGFPEGLLIYTVNDTVVTAFGAADLLDAFEANMKTAYASAALVVDKPIE